MKQIILFSITLLSTFLAYAVEPDTLGRNPKYVANIILRSQKITDALNICLPTEQKKVLHIIANRYFQLNDIYEKRDAQLATVKTDTTLSADQKKIRNEQIQAEKDAALYRTRFAFLAALQLYLSNVQIESVKDGMTFGVLMVTYNSTLDMIPSLKVEEKKQIMAWLSEARELAIDAESSEKKHAIFGKYKGRINNYLSVRGYNLTIERENWYKRIEEKKKRGSERL